jgi:protein-tyrosine phosphatase
MLDYQFVTDRLAIGSSVRTAEAMRELARAGITHVVNVQIEFDNRRLSEGTGVRVLWNGCEDDCLPKPPGFFWAGVRFTLDALKSPDSKVLFHCAAGIHRSPLMLLAVLRALGHDEDAGIQMIRQARPEAHFPALYLASLDEFMQEYEGLATLADFDCDEVLLAIRSLGKR